MLRMKSSLWKEHLLLYLCCLNEKELKVPPSSLMRCIHVASIEGFCECGAVIERTFFLHVHFCRIDTTEPSEENTREKALVITYLWATPLWKLIEVSIFYKILKIKWTPVVNFVDCCSSNLLVCHWNLALSALYQ